MSLSPDVTGVPSSIPMQHDARLRSPPDVGAIRDLARRDGLQAALHLTHLQLDQCGRHPDLLQLSGELLLTMGRDAEALPWLDEACTVQPDNVDAWNQRALALSHLGRHDAAHEAYLHAVRLAPGVAALYANIGSNLNNADRCREAEHWLRRGLEIDPDAPALKTNLAISLIHQSRTAQAVALVDGLLKSGYQPIEVLEAKATLLNMAGRYAEAEKLLRLLLDNHAPDQAPRASLLRLLSSVMGSLGKLDEQLALLRQEVALNPGALDAQSSLIFMLNYAQHSDGAMLLAEARRYGDILRTRTASRGLRAYTAWQCDPQPTRLRVGLVSGDLRSHPIGYFLDDLVPAMAACDIELVAYSNVLVEDALTERMKSNFSTWHTIAGLDDVQTAKLIHDDRIHVLVDMSGHSDRQRLPVFALKPAPVQASWIGYLGTTGVPEIDWVIADSYMAPPGEPSHFVERIWRMRNSCVHLSAPADGIAPEVLPVPTRGHVTFGSFNNLAKMTDAVVALWARVLHAVAGSCLFLKCPQLKEPAVVQRTLARYAAHGITADRLILEGPSPRADLLAAYNRMDIALDPFPYTGTTTSLEALWMSVPMLSMRGDRFMSRMGESLLMNAGLPGWIADDADHLVQLAVAHVADVDALAGLRAGGLRDRLLASPLMNTAQFARDLERAFWGMWKARSM